MKDRVSLYPGRVKLTPVSGQENTYDMVRADEPTQEGTQLNKATLLKDATAALLGLESDAVPDDALVTLYGLSHNAISFKLLWENASPSSRFAAQTVSLDLSTYSLVYIEYAIWDGGNELSSAFFKVGTVHVTNSIVYADGQKVYYRTSTSKENGVEFSNAVLLGTSTVTNSMVIPVRIYGIKGVETA